MTEGADAAIAAHKSPSIPAKCIYCANDLAEGAMYCAQCSKFQRPWRNWIAELGNVAAALTVSGALLVFAGQQLSSFEENRANRLRQEDAEAARLVGSLLSAFSQTAATLDRAATTYTEVLIAAEGERRMSDALAGQVFVRAMPGDCLAGASRCRLQLLERSGTDQGPLAVENPTGNLSALLQQMRKYIEALGTIAAAENSTQVMRGFEVAKSAIAKVASSIYPAGAPALALSIDVDPNGSDVREVRWRALRAATTTANPLVLDAAELLGTATGFATIGAAVGYDQRFSDAGEQFRADPTSSNLANLSRVAKAFDVFLTANPEPLWRKWADAHALMTERLQLDASFQDVFDRLTELQEDAQLLESTLEETRVASPQPQK